MLELYALIDRLARGSINVLILGETGAGKEVVAEAIHRASPRSGRALVRINCAALAEPLLESELFGHERGAFTGAVSAKQGLIEAADGGAIFLDEVAELPASLQAKLLRVIEAGEITRVGSVRARPVDVRFISATNKDPREEVERGNFRADLLYRLNGASLEVPPLRERPLEIIPLAESFVARVAEQIRLPAVPLLSAEAADCLLVRTWPGNVRELRNVMERAVLVCDGTRIEPTDLSADACNWGQSPTGDGAGPAARTANLLTPVPHCAPTTSADPCLEPERQRILNALIECGGNQSRAGKVLGIPRRTLVRRIAQLGLRRPHESTR
jgi:DNA-binding NtrC family response regulator